MKREIEKLRNIITSANPAKYGPKTSTLSKDQLALSFELPSVQLEFPTEKEVEVPAHTRHRRGREPLSDSLPREEDVYTPDVTHCANHVERVCTKLSEPDWYARFLHVKRLDPARSPE